MPLEGWWSVRVGRLCHGYDSSRRCWDQKTIKSANCDTGLQERCPPGRKSSVERVAAKLEPQKNSSDSGDANLEQRAEGVGPADDLERLGESDTFW